MLPVTSLNKIRQKTFMIRLELWGLMLFQLNGGGQFY